MCVAMCTCVRDCVCDTWINMWILWIWEHERNTQHKRTNLECINGSQNRKKENFYYEYKMKKRLWQTKLKRMIFYGSGNDDDDDSAIMRLVGNMWEYNVACDGDALWRVNNGQSCVTWTQSQNPFDNICGYAATDAVCLLACSLSISVTNLCNDRTVFDLT